MWYNILGAGSEKGCRLLLGTGLEEDMDDLSWPLCWTSLMNWRIQWNKGVGVAYSFLWGVTWTTAAMFEGYPASVHKALAVLIARQTRKIYDATTSMPMLPGETPSRTMASTWLR